MIHIIWQFILIPILLGLILLVMALFLGEMFLIAAIFTAARNSYRKRNQPKDEEPKQ